MKKIVLFGAFDRYNYGDNLMPIVFQRYVSKYFPKVLDSYEFEFAAISASNLENFHCEKSVKINDIVDSLPAGSSIIVIGGEVLCASNADLMLHMQKSQIGHKVAVFCRKNLTKIFNLYAQFAYSTKWDYPFIIDKSCLPDGVKVLYNTIGGQVNPNNKHMYQKVMKRIISADYFSVRDSRTLTQTAGKRDVALSPDSVFLLPAVVDDEFLKKQVKSSIYELASQSPKYVFQAAPAKIDCTVDALIEQVQTLSDETQSKVILLPIGYASGHDDLHLMQDIHEVLPDKTILLSDLNVWEILFVIKQARAFMGTSLHGVITAMAYGLPHFGLNINIGKLNAFVAEWSIAPYNQSYSVAELSKLPKLIKEDDLPDLTRNASAIIQKVKANNEAMINVITSDSPSKNKDAS
ncbi:polysaccharide pyruvyl transferase family protein [Catenovulum maritimum]|uniref:Polysaccharide pyruvyl transferase domain-containing protein n=1 Tax=Catenovulum maritimum TaxID=1513271 RepID=A0A0J8GTJ4_9ALTE|nr:polysaccharide pyruvyl transferase family protein [Catenovulum maritimum]KMT64634.1 hypothetical protein XM47_13410 [Catenovulum maritimum]